MNKLIISKQKLLVFYLLASLFIIINSVVIIKFESLAFNIVPVAVIVFLAVFFALDKLLLYSVFLVPLSVPLQHYMPHLGFNVELPTEIFFTGFTILFIFQQIIERNFDRNVVKHPISIAVMIYLGWMLITVFTSTMPVVSIKRWLSTVWFIIPFYFMISQLFRKKENIYRFFWLYIIPLIIVIFYTLINHAEHNFIQNAASFVVTPFYNDHTAYGAVLAMFIPVVVGLIANKKLSGNTRTMAFIVLLIFITGFIFSFSRAAWISLLGGIITFFILRFKINYKYILTFIGVVFISFFVFQNDIYRFLEKNTQDSSTDFREHIRSATNVATDASNVERINRWNCAIRMYREKPVFGWGPGTYQFQYAPFQFSYEKTIISTNVGDMGNAHSEYLGSLSESGLLGMLTFVVMSLMVLIYGVQNYIKARSKEIKVLLASTVCGFTTYLLHGFLNNFLDTDKASVPFWGFASIIMIIDLYHNKTDSDEIQQA